MPTLLPQCFAAIVATVTATSPLQSPPPPTATCRLCRRLAAMPPIASLAADARTTTDARASAVAHGRRLA